jgi:hypothetical protein
VAGSASAGAATATATGDGAATAISAARGAAAVARTQGATGGATSGAVTTSGEVFTGASTKAGGAGVATNPTVQAALDAVPQAVRPAYHGCCGEIAVMSNILNAGSKVEGAIVATARAAGHEGVSILRCGGGKVARHSGGAMTNEFQYER